MNDVRVARRSHKQQADRFGTSGMEHSADTVRHVVQVSGNACDPLTGRLTYFAVVKR